MATEFDLPAPRSLGRALNFATGVTNALCQAKLSPHDITLAQWVILSALWRQDGLTVRALAQYTGNNVPATSRILDRMAQKALVTRQPDPDDQRSIRLCLAPKGDALRFLATFYNDINAALLGDMPQSQADQLFELLEAVQHNAVKAIADTASAHPQPGTSRP